MKPTCTFSLLLLCVCGFAPISGVRAQNSVPRFETADCVVPVPQNEKNAKCGFLIVPESRKHRSGKTIRLPVIILKTENPNPQPDPVLRTLGGPGASSMRMIGSRPFSPWLKDRDVIILEQRGTRYAQPALDCPEVDAANIMSAKLSEDTKTARKNELRAARVCFERLTGRGINLNAYNSAESAADIEDLRRALNLEKINLYGISYSSRLMLNVMRDFPKGIRSVVLESTLPVEVNYDEAGVDMIVATLNVLFKNCKNDAACARAYPNLENEFYEVVANLNRAPLSVRLKEEKTGTEAEIKLNGNDFATWIVDYLFSNEASAITNAPMVIHAAFAGNYARQFRDYANDKLGSSPYSLGMRYSVWCSEEIPFENKRKIKAQSFLYPRLPGYEVMSLPDICDVWKVSRAKSIENKPVKSDIPTLILSAEYDAYTPPAWGKMTSGNLKNNFYFEIPWTGHGPAFSVPCARTMIADFIDSPETAPASDCLAKFKAQFKFVIAKP